MAESNHEDFGNEKIEVIKVFITSMAEQNRLRFVEVSNCVIIDGFINAANVVVLPVRENHLVTDCVLVAGVTLNLGIKENGDVDDEVDLVYASAEIGDLSLNVMSFVVLGKDVDLDKAVVHFVKDFERSNLLSNLRTDMAFGTGLGYTIKKDEVEHALSEGLNRVSNS